MNDFEKIFNFNNLYEAHKVARLGKRKNKEVIDFEMDLANNLILLSDALKNETYKISGYYSFMVHDPKDRIIHALHYKDRVVQHCICDFVIGPTLDKKLIYDNSACRLRKGTHFAINRVSKFLHNFYKEYKTDGYILKCDIHKFFDNIDHNVLKQKLLNCKFDEKTMNLLSQIIDSYTKCDNNINTLNTTINEMKDKDIIKKSDRGLPLGNQTSQWFAIYYLDSLDRLIKEKLHIKYYSRYMDDLILIHNNKKYLTNCLAIMKEHIKNLKLEFNSKTQIFPIKKGVDYLGFHFYLTKSGKVIRKLRTERKIHIKRKFKRVRNLYSKSRVELDYINQMVNSYSAHLSHGHTYKLWHKILSSFVLKRD